MWYKRTSFLCAAALAAFAGGCAVGPNYLRPTAAAQLPASFEIPPGWKVAQPRDEEPLKNWWTCFDDGLLNRLIEQGTPRNQDLLAAFYRVEQARAVARSEVSVMAPSLSLDASVSRAGRSGTIRNAAENLQGVTTTNFLLPLVLDYEIDFWGKLRRGIEAARAQAMATEAAFRQASLTLQAELAIQRINLRSLDTEIAILREAVALRQTSLELNRKRFEVGDTDEVAVSQAETELASAESELAGLQRRRAEIENAIAVLVGLPSSGFRLEPAPLRGEPPRVPVLVPCALLERRPDVAEAERVMAAENARIGVAKAAFFPAVSLDATLGLESGALRTLFNSASGTWGVGADIVTPLFEGGRNLAELRRAKARYEEVVAGYRQTVLDAVREVDDALEGLRWLAEQQTAQDRMVAAGRRTVELSRRRYEAGVVDYFEVVDAQRTLLDAEQRAVRIRAARFLSTVALIKALGGGWD